MVCVCGLQTQQWALKATAAVGWLMWVVYLKGEACFWLLGGELYTVGKKDCHITIQDDASISRKHLTLEVGMLETRDEFGQQARKTNDEVTEEEDERSASIILTDMSTYGTEVGPLSSSCNLQDSPGDDDNVITRELQLCRGNGMDVDNTDDDDDATVVGGGTRFKLLKGEPFHVPRDMSWRNFLVVLGTHGASLQLRWAPMRVFILGVTVEQKTKLDCSLQHCGADVVKDFHCADYFVTSCLTPTPVAIAALCRSVDIVRPAYFEALRDRCGPHVPPPDPRAFTPPLASFWSLLWSGGGDGDDRRDGGGDDGVEALLLHPPNRQDRRRLFADLTFVTVQRSLYKEVRVFLPCAQGTVLLDESLLGACDEERRERVIASFYSQHYRHVILYNSRERLPFRNFSCIMREQLGMCCVEYFDVIRGIAQAAPLTLTSFPTSPTLKLQRRELLVKEKAGGKEAGALTTLVEEVATAAAGVKRPQKMCGSDGRRTDPNPLFGEVLSDAETEMKKVRAEQQQHDDADDEQYQTDVKRRKGEVDGWVRRELGADPDAKDLVVTGPPDFPPYPCFQPYAKDTRNSGVGAPAFGASGGKCFQKQELTLCGDTVEMDRSSDALGNTVLSTVRAIDADDIIPETLGESAALSGRSHFNVFDAVAHHHTSGSRAAATRRRAGRGDVARDVPMTTRDANPVEDMAVGSTNVLGCKKAGGTSLNIFDIDAFF